MPKATTDPKGYKDSLLGKMPQDWKIGKLEDLAINHDGSRIPLKQSDRDRMEGIYPYYGASGIIDWVNGYLFDGNYVLLGEDGENVVSRNLPLAFQVTGKFWVNNHAHIYQPLPNVDIRFLTILLEHTDYRPLVSGSAQPKLTQEALSRLLFRVPPFREQQYIAEILDTIDSTIAHTSTLIAKLKQMKAGLLHDLLTRGLDENEKLRDAIEHPEQFKDSPLGQIPKDWKYMTINSCLQENLILDVQDGNHGEAHPKAEDFVKEGVPFLMANDLVDGGIDFEGCHKITEQQYRSLRVGFAEPGDVLLSHKGTIGQTAIVPFHVQKVMLTPQVTYHRVSGNGILEAEFLLWFYRSNIFQHRLEVLSAQSTRAFIGITLQKVLPVLLPSIEEQKRIVEILNSHEARIVAEQTYLSKLKEQKKGLMHDLLTGRVRVTDLKEIPA